MKINRTKLEVEMAKQGVTVLKLASITGLSVTGISKIKNGLQNARPATIGKIAKALNVPVENLIEG